MQGCKGLTRGNVTLYTLRLHGHLVKIAGILRMNFFPISTSRITYFKKPYPPVTMRLLKKEAVLEKSLLDNTHPIFVDQVKIMAVLG